MGKDEYLEIDGNKLDGDYTVSDGDVTDAITLSGDYVTNKSIYVSIASLASGTATLKIEVLKPDGDVDTASDWIEYHMESSFDISVEGEAYPLMFESATSKMRIKFSSMPTSSNVTAWISERLNR